MGSLVASLRLFTWIVVLSLALLPADVALPVVGGLASLGVKGWLLGREYFELAARGILRAPRWTPFDAGMEQQYWAGLVIAALAEIPVVNFAAPQFGAAFMVHVFKHFQYREHPA